jgi:hypothetical protein
MKSWAMLMRAVSVRIAMRPYRPMVLIQAMAI